MSTVTQQQEIQGNAWWQNLEKEGFMFSESTIEGLFPNGPPVVNARMLDNLRYAFDHFRINKAYAQERENEVSKLARAKWVETLVTSLSHKDYVWRQFKNSGSKIIKTPVESGGNFALLPRKKTKNLSEARLFVLIVHGDQRLGIGRMRKYQAEFTRQMVDKGIQFGLFTNGSQIRLIYATLDHQAWVTWNCEDMLREEGMSALGGFIGLLSEGKKGLEELVQESRTSQSVLSSQIGEQIREAIEVFLSGETATLEQTKRLVAEILPEGYREKDVTPNDLVPIYHASIRIMLRLVVILYSEARFLLPVASSPVYQNTYSLEKIWRDLEDAKTELTEDEMNSTYTAWFKVLGLFRLIYFGSPFSEFNIKAYSGQLFRPGSMMEDQKIGRILQIFESGDWRITDHEMHRILSKLKFAPVVIRQGRKKRKMTMPVNFTTLGTEYIGMIYEGLLDYQVRWVKEEDIGAISLRIKKDEIKVLSLQLLSQLSDRELKKLFKTEKSKKKKAREENVEDNDDEIIDPSGLNLSELAYHKARKFAKRFKRVTKSKFSLDELITHVYPPGKIYISTWNGSRKSTGTYYTSPGLVKPTVRRTLEPLVKLKDGSYKSPEEILELNIVDPAMGSGSFLIGALNYLSEALGWSLEQYNRISLRNKIIKCQISGNILLEYEDESIEETSYNWDKLIQKLKRVVTESCIYGVDINPLAVELAKLSLWIETMDNTLPFKFLDHKLKCGNSLLGAWSIQLLPDYYPINAFNRPELLNNLKSHKPFKEIKKTFKQQYRSSKQLTLEESLKFNETKNEIAEERRKIFSDLFETKKYEHYYRIIKSDKYRAIKRKLDIWISLWFIPYVEFIRIEDDLSPSNIEKTLIGKTKSDEVDKIIEEIVNKWNFFHWEIEFPEIFTYGGFHAILGNPPWEKSSRVERNDFFINYHPMFKDYATKESKLLQKELLKLDTILSRWIEYNNNVNAFKNFIDNSGLFIENESHININYGREEIPFNHQGKGDRNYYKLFCEFSIWLTANGGRVGMILDSGVGLDVGSNDLRKQLLRITSWEWFYSFLNRKKIFDIGQMMAFAAIIVQKGGSTIDVRTLFFVLDLEDWERCTPDSPDLFLQNEEMMRELTGDQFKLIPISTSRKFNLMLRMTTGEDNYKKYTSRRMNYEDWGLKYRSEFHASGDSSQFIKGDYYRARLNKFGIYKDNELTLLPVYRGKNIQIGDFAATYYLSGSGTKVKTDPTSPNREFSTSEYYMSLSSAVSRMNATPMPKIAFRDVARATDARSIFAAIIPNYPCINKIPTLIGPPNSYLQLCGIMISFPFDFIARIWITKANVSKDVLSLIGFPKELSTLNNPHYIKNALNYFCNAPVFAHYWLYYRNQVKYYKKFWAITEHERTRLYAIINACTAYIYNLAYEDFGFILRYDENDLQGFSKVDKKKPENMRIQTFCLMAYRELLDKGIERFLEADWQLPEYAQEALGPRFLDWQIEMDDDGWNRCIEEDKELHEIYGDTHDPRALEVSQASRAENMEVSQAPRAKSMQIPKQSSLNDHFGGV